MTPIETAVAPVKADAIERAEQEAHKIVKSVEVALKIVDGDLDKAAPRPDSFRMNRRDYQNANTKRKTFSMLTTREGFAYGENIVRMDPVRIERFIEQARLDAAAQYDAFVAKLVHKVGPHSSATLEGNHVWGHSILTVTTPTGVQRWKTQMIVNVSKLGKLFNQWPSRKVK